ncbi:nmrA-like family protein [Hirsutella rhossiliensis]|uniref:NmrA-like family domain-containing protein n=1 Tax=Hirsutella rhossiliensis TaxID=111463 RepID=A0A9P8MNL8_9HYPO|nr:nmrA-like family domain-containing protein [Hirsutella rhossiliensis]KAH0958314.1 nmrA-like family domain-containing protein [Hirsutella rhossiliensis]
MAATIAIFGATGKQGGSVAQSLLQNPSFRVRAITRNPSSEASRTLASAGAEIAQADGFHEEEILAAFQGSWGAFVNLNSDDKIWRDPEGPTEFDLGKIIVDAAARAGVKHLVFSSGPPCVDMTGGKVKMNAMEMKYRIEQCDCKKVSISTDLTIMGGV